MIFDLIRNRTWNFKDETLSGLTVALALVPEAVAFAFVAGVSPIIGLYSAFFIGLIAATCGGRPGMICGATGAMAVIVVTLVAVHGLEYLFPAVILCGIIPIGVGIARLGKLIRIDVSGGGAYALPPGNPFAGAGGARCQAGAVAGGARDGTDAR